MKKYIKILLLLFSSFYCVAQIPKYISSKAELKIHAKKIVKVDTIPIGYTTGTLTVRTFTNGTSVTRLEADTIPVMIMFSDTAYWTQATLLWVKGYKIIDWSNNDSYLLNGRKERFTDKYFIWLVKERKK